MLEVNIFPEAQRKSVLQFFSGRIQQQNTEHLVIDEPPQKFCNPVQQFIQIQNGRQFAGDFIEQEQNARLARGARVKLCVFNSTCDSGSYQSQQTAVFLSEVARVPCFQIDHANHTVLGDKRHCQLRAHIGHRGNILGVLGNVVDEDRLSRLGSLPGHTLAQLYPRAIGERSRITHLEAKAQFLRLLV